MTPLRLGSSLAAPASALALLACSSGPSVPAYCSRHIGPGPDDRAAAQTMFEEAQDGETLCFLPGTYRFDDPIEIRGHRGITIRGTTGNRADVILDFSMQGSGNDGLAASMMTDLVIQDMTILDAAHNNVFVTDSDGVTMRNLSSGWVVRPPMTRGTYALYPVQSTDVLIEDSEAFGSPDAGFYVGQTTRCIVRNNVAHGNVAGIEIENSVDCEVYGNEAYDNSAGILVFELPDLAMRGHGTLVHDNIARDNNLENFAQGGIVSYVPTGIGIMILAANDVEIRDNDIRGNQSMGITVVSYTTVLALDGPMHMDAGYDPYIDGIWIHDNDCMQNGQMPWPPLNLVLAQQMPMGSTLEDILFDGELAMGAADDLCVRETSCTFRRADIRDTFATQSTDTAPYACTGTTVPPVTLE